MSTYVTFLPEGARFESGEGDALARLAETDASIGAVGSVLVAADGRARHAGYLLREWNPGERLQFASLRRPMARDVLAVSGIGMLVRGEALERIGAEIEHAATPGGAVDLCLKLRAAGYRIVVQPESRVVAPEFPIEPTVDELRGLTKAWAGMATPDEADRRREEGLSELAGLVDTLRELRRSVARVHPLPEYDLPAPSHSNGWTSRLPWNAARREAEITLLPQYRALEAAARLMERLDG